VGEAAAAAGGRGGSNLLLEGRLRLPASPSRHHILGHKQTIFLVWV